MERLPQVFFDESGHSGPNLIRPTEPVLVLASACLSFDQIESAEKHFSFVKADEWKFKNFRRRSNYLEALVELIEGPWFSPATVKAFVVHKRFMVVTKIVDLLQEPLARHCGVNIYERGGNIAMANLFYSVWPTFLGEQRFSRKLEAFVKAVRERSTESLDTFFDVTLDCYNHLERTGEVDMAAALSPHLISTKHPELWLDDIGKFEMDPLIPAYFTLIDEWGQELQERFDVISDQSKTLDSEVEILKAFSAVDIREHHLSGPGGDAHFPLKINTVHTVDSKLSRQVQIADLIAGSLASVFSTMACGKKLEDWQDRVRQVIASRPICNAIWPSHAVTPEALGTEHLTGETIVDYSTKILAQDPATKK